MGAEFAEVYKDDMSLDWCKMTNFCGYFILRFLNNDILRTYCLILRFTKTVSQLSGILLLTQDLNFANFQK